MRRGARKRQNVWRRSFDPENGGLPRHGFARDEHAEAGGLAAIYRSDKLATVALACEIGASILFSLVCW